MGKKEANRIDPFAVISSELSGELIKPSAPDATQEPQQPETSAENTAGLSGQTADVFAGEPSAAGQRMPSAASEKPQEEPAESGCFGYVTKGILIVILALALAWIIFMPSGSLMELKDHVFHVISQRVTGSAMQSEGNTASSTTLALTTAPTTTQTQPTTATEVTNAEATTVATVAVTTVTTTTTARPKTTTTARTTTTTTAAASEESVYNADQGYIYVYLQSQIVVVYDSNGNVRKAFTCSSGKASTPTKTGDYTIRSKYRWRLMIGNCYTQYASSFSSGYLFHSIPYNRRNAGTMSDASYDKLGSPASSGCIRLCFRDSKWIYDYCPIGTGVRVVDDTAPMDIVTVPIVPRITDAAHSGWDPTDTAAANPYNQ